MMRLFVMDFMMRLIIVNFCFVGDLFEVSFFVVIQVKMAFSVWIIIMDLVRTCAHIMLRRSMWTVVLPKPT